jgi:hypothetical protein
LKKPWLSGPLAGYLRVLFDNKKYPNIFKLVGMVTVEHTFPLHRLELRELYVDFLFTTELIFLGIFVTAKFGENKGNAP